MYTFQCIFISQTIGGFLLRMQWDLTLSIHHVRIFIGTTLNPFT